MGYFEEKKRKEEMEKKKADIMAIQDRRKRWEKIAENMWLFDKNVPEPESEQYTREVMTPYGKVLVDKDGNML